MTDKINSKTAAQRPHGSSYLANTGTMTSGKIFDNNRLLINDSGFGKINAIGEWDLMIKTDPVVAAGFRAMTSVLQGVSFDFAYNDEIGDNIREYTEMCFFEAPAKKFDEYAQQVWRAIRWGFAPQEITLRREGKYWVVNDLGERRPRTIRKDSVIVDPDTGWVHAKQEFYDSKNKLIVAEYANPGDKNKGWLLWPVYGDDGSPFGESILRSIWYIHKRKIDAIKSMGLAIQRINGTPYVRANPDALIEPDEDIIGETVERIALLRNHEQSCIYLPAWVDDQGIRWAYPSDNAIDHALNAIKHYNIEIMTAFHAQWMARGLMSAHGTNSANESDEKAGKNIRAAFLRWLENQFQPLINYMIDLNFGKQKFYPSLQCNYVEEMSANDLANIMQQLVTAGIVEQGNQRELEEYARNAFRWPDIDKDSIHVESGSVLLSTVGGMTGYAALMDSYSRGAITRDALISALATFFKIDETEAEKMVGAKEKNVPNPESENSDPVISDNSDNSSVPVAPLRSTRNTTGVTADFAQCSCGHNHFVDHNVQGRSAPKLGGQNKRTGPNNRPLGIVESICNFNALELNFDNGQKTLEQALMDARYAMASDILSQVQDADWQTSEELADVIESLKPSKATVAQYKKRVNNLLNRIAEDGKESVYQEYQKQTTKLPVNNFAVDGSDSDSDKRRKVIANKEIRNAENDVIDQLVTASLQVIGEDRKSIYDLLAEAASELSGAQAKAGATLASSETFARAREAAAQEIAQVDPPQQIWYSAVLDANTCSECLTADNLHSEFGGTPIEPGSAEHAEFMPPYQRCLGGVRCRCILVYDWS